MDAENYLRTYHKMTPTQKTDYTRQLQKQAVKNIATFAAVKIGLAILLHCFTKAILKRAE